MSVIHLSPDQRRQMQKLAEQVDRVTRADAKFFERFNREHRVRLASRAEIDQHEIIEGPIFLPDGCRTFVVVRNIAPVFRLRWFVGGIEGSETDLDDSTARQIFEMSATPQTWVIEAQFCKTAEAR